MHCQLEIGEILHVTIFTLQPSHFWLFSNIFFQDAFEVVSCTEVVSGGLTDCVPLLTFFANAHDEVCSLQTLYVEVCSLQTL